jgi:heme exporter protein B
MVSAMFLFSLLMVIAFRFGFSDAVSSNSIAIEDLAASALWICFSFAAIVGMHNAFAKEKDRETLDGLLLCPVDRSAIFLGKALSSFVLVFLVDVLSIFFFALFFSFDFGGNVLEVLAVAFVGTLTLVLVGTLVAAISVNARAREAMLPILLIPLIAFTVIIPCVNATRNAIQGDLTESFRDLVSIAGFAVIFGVIGYLAFDFVVEG